MSTLDAPPRPYAGRGAAALAVAPARRAAPRPAPQEQPRHLRVVRPAERARRRLTPATGVLLTGLVFVTLFAIAVAHTVLVQGQIRLDDLDGQLSAEQARYRALRTEVAAAESPARIVAAAQELGMVTPDDLVYLQPVAPDPSADAMSAEPAGDALARRAAAAGADPAAGTGRTWSSVKPLLGTPSP